MEEELKDELLETYAKLQKEEERNITLGQRLEVERNDALQLRKLAWWSNLKSAVVGFLMPLALLIGVVVEHSYDFIPGTRNIESSMAIGIPRTGLGEIVRASEQSGNSTGPKPFENCQSAVEKIVLTTEAQGYDRKEEADETEKSYIYYYEIRYADQPMFFVCIESKYAPTAYGYFVPSLEFARPIRSENDLEQMVK